MTTIVGVGYRVTTNVPRGFSVSHGYVVSDASGDAWIRTPETTRFLFPEFDGIPTRVGVSETIGLFGGVEDRRQLSFSEATERAIGDVLTTSICEILDACRASESTRIFIFGLAFPKLVGRIYSLRPSPSNRIFWICPRPFPAWIAEGVNESVLLVSSRAGFATEWDDEALVASYQTCFENDTPSVLVQELRLWTPRSQPDVSGLTFVHAGIFNTLLPREIIVATGQVQNHCDLPYVDQPEEKLRSLPSEFCGALYEAASNQRRHWPSWDIRWLPIP